MAGPFQSLHIEPVGGVAGDMLLGALLDLGADPAPIQGVFRSLGMEGLDLRWERVVVGEVPAVTVRSLAPSPEHHHRHLRDIEALLDRAALPARARAFAGRVFRILCEAEAEVHGGDAETVHLHEVGEVDSILDVVGIALALEQLGHPPRVRCDPLPSGSGTVDTAHGVLEVPVPAVRAVCTHHGLPMVSVDLPGETVTPTGVAVVAALCAGGGAAASTPAGAQVGVGAGTRRFEARPNVVRIYGW